jgi:hypothetical protein
MDMESNTAIPAQGERSLRTWVGMALVGAVILAAGMLQTTSATVQPDCPVGTLLVAKFEYSGNRYVFERPAGNEKVVTILDANAQGGSWTSSTPITAIIVKGGPGSKLTELTPAQTSGTFGNEGLTNSSDDTGTPAVSNVQFCAPDPSATTTTTVAESTTTSSIVGGSTTTSSIVGGSTTTSSIVGGSTTTSSIVGGSTTTSSIVGGSTTTSTVDESPTTSTVNPSTTTSQVTTTSAPTTTTESTTTSQVTSTTVDGNTTTTVDGNTTTTVDGNTTTTVDGNTTTTGPEVENQVVVNTTIVADDAEQVLGTGEVRTLARTGSPSVPMVLIGILLLGIGSTMAMVNRRRGASD